MRDDGDPARQLVVAVVIGLVAGSVGAVVAVILLSFDLPQLLNTVVILVSVLATAVAVRRLVAGERKRGG